MSIRQKAVAALVTTLAALVGVLYAVLGSLLGAGFGAVETSAARRNVERVRETIQNETAGLCQKVNDWAYWDDAYAYAGNPNDDFVKANVAASTFQAMQIDHLMVFGASGNLLLGASYDLATESLAPLPQSLLGAHFGAGSALLRHEGKGSVHSGFITTPNGATVLACSMPILTTGGEGPARGTMVFARLVDERFRSLLSRITRLDVRLAVEGDPTFTGEFASVLPRLTGAEPVDVEVASEERLVGSTRYATLAGDKPLVIRAGMSREIHKEASRTRAYVLVALVVVGLAFAIVIFALLERLVIGRTSRLAAEVTKITDTFDFSLRVQEQGTDEIGRLGGAVNGLLSAVEQVIYGSGVHSLGPEGR